MFLSPRIKVLRLRYVIIGIYCRNPPWLQSQLHVSNTYRLSCLAKIRWIRSVNFDFAPNNSHHHSLSIRNNDSSSSINIIIIISIPIKTRFV
ncbi:hypothetical protein HanLR1_Chr05g0171801 [Helianthus annuus]|nr:hypothetical protein HanLR1_Chr05g0171801 [Helianthus annuus]